MNRERIMQVTSAMLGAVLLLIASTGAWPQQSASPGYGQTITKAQVSGTSKAMRCSLPRDSMEKTIEAFKQQAASGDAAAQCGLGVMYEHGDSVVQDYAQAAVWWRKASEQGIPEAQYDLGGLYLEGKGVPQDYAQAAVWYRQASEQGYAMAQWKLGYLYDNGEGVPRDDKQAALWWRKSAEQGDLQAQCGLALLYHDGLGVPKDYAEAYFWYDLAAASVPVALLPDSGPQIVKWRDEAASHLTPADLSRAQERARQWFEAWQAKQ